MMLIAAVYLVSALGATAEPLRAGWTEVAHFPKLGVTLQAKLDTGAKTSTLGGLSQRRFTRNGQDWVSFLVADEAGRQSRIERPIVRFAKIRRAGVPVQTRPVVELEVCVAGVSKRGEFTITDRRGMRFGVLLGRRFLAGRIVVDAGAERLNDGACGG